VAITKQFQVNDSLITCNTCHWDECGNLINSNSDTLYENKGLVHPGFNPVFLTIDTILLTKKNVQTLLDKNKIRHMQFLHCNEVASKMGFIALEGVYLIALKDTVILSCPLIDAVNKSYETTDIAASQVLVNGYHIYADKIKYPITTGINIKYLEQYNRYCVLTE